MKSPVIPWAGSNGPAKTPEKIADELSYLDIFVCANTVSGLLRQMGFSPRVNHKKLESGNRSRPSERVRNTQFEHITHMRENFASQGNPVISVDAKKKQLIGLFKNEGRSWQQEPIAVNDHDFLSDAQGRAVPYGIYDTQANLGYVYLGMSAETPAFAVDAITWWWRTYGLKMYGAGSHLLILADCGGSNSPRPRAWKYYLQHQLANQYELTVSVCHYPAGASKWNPIEHRLFAEVSKNWAGKPLESFETALKYIRTTATSSGLKTKARLTRKHYPKGESASDAEMDQLNLTRNAPYHQWNYTIGPAKM